MFSEPPRRSKSGSERRRIGLPSIGSAQEGTTIARTSSTSLHFLRCQMLTLPSTQQCPPILKFLFFPLRKTLRPLRLIPNFYRRGRRVFRRGRRGGKADIRDSWNFHTRQYIPHFISPCIFRAQD